MKKKRRKFQKQTTAVTAIALSAGLLLNPFAPVVGSVHAKTMTSAEQLLANLTAEQREALLKLQTTDTTGLHLDDKVNTESDELISVIVEFKQKPGKVAVLEAKMQGKELSLSEAKQKVNDAHQIFKEEMSLLFDGNQEQEKIDYKINRIYKNAFNGVSMTIPANQAEALLSTETVKAVWSNQEVQGLPPVQDSEATGIHTSQMSGGMELLGIDKLHEEGFTGEGIKVGVIDTGVDYNHPDLQAAYIGGYDFVDNDANPMETTYEDWQKSGWAERHPMSESTYYTEHGTHVAGIIVGQGKNESSYKMTGVAPDADLYAYRVLGRYGSGLSENIIAAIDKAVEDGMDVINLSLGASTNNPLYPTSIAVNQAVLSGVTAVVAAGNSGNGMYTLGSPGTAGLALTVGASSEPYRLYTFKGVLQAGTDAISADLQQLAKGYADDITQLNGKSYPIISVGLGASSDYKNKDVNGKIVLVSRGNITLNDKVKYAKQNGAAAVLLYNNVPEEGHIPAFIGDSLDFIPAFSLTNAQGVALKEKINAESTFTFNELGQVQTQGDALADFSSRGPSRINYDIKPEVTAPGVTVLSTVPSYMINAQDQTNYQYAYKRLSGTSMAAPHTAGVSALLLQANPDLEPGDVKSILMNTADPLTKEYSVYEVGAGRIDAYEAIHSTIEIKVLDENPTLKKDKEKSIKEETGAISFGSVDLSEDVHEDRTLNLSNQGDEAKTFDVSVVYQTGLRGGKSAEDNDVKVSIEPTIKIGAKQQRKTNVSISIPKSAERGIYEGYVVYRNQENPEETYQIPFGVHAVEEGIEMFQTYTNGISVDRFRDQYSSRFVQRSTNVYFQLKSNMRYVDFILVDGKTSEDLGLLGSIDGLQLSEGIPYNAGNVFKGHYYPFNDKSSTGISSIPVVANEGFYKIKMVATSENGEQFTEVQDVVVDNGRPKITFNVPDIIELEEGQKTVTISGTILDQDIEDFKAAGMDIDQSVNKILDLRVEQGAPPIEMPVNQDGTFNYEIPVGPNGDLLNLAAVDSAGNGIPKTIRVVKKGTPYLVASFDQKSPKPGEAVKVKFVMKNAVNFKKGTVNFSASSDYFNYENVELHPESSKLGEVKLTKTALNRVTIEVAEGNTQTLNGEIPLVEATMIAKDYNFEIRPDTTSLYMGGSSYQDRSGKTTSLAYNTPNFELEPTYSKLKSILYADGLLTSSGTFDSKRDYSKVGADVSIQDAEGNTYNDVLTRYGRIEALHLSLTDNPLNLVVNVPGHFKTIYEFKIGMKNEEGELIGQFTKVDVPTLSGGDVNGDDVIDIMDALSIETNWGTNNRDADINFDGTVDAKDMTFVEKNYLKQNPSIETAPKPKEQYMGKTLVDIKHQLGLN